jgi:hypothetical protein
VFVEDDRGLHRNNRGVPEESMKQVMQLVHDRGVTRTNRVHLDDLAFEQLHPLLLREDADLAHPSEFGHGKLSPFNVSHKGNLV